MNSNLTLVFAGALILAGCSDGADQSKEMAEHAAKLAEQARTKVEQTLPSDAPANIEDAIGRVGEALSGKGEQSVSAANLKTLLPEKLGGLDRVEYEAERAGFGIKVSKARARYGDKDHMLSLMITDLGAVAGLAKMGMELFDTEIDKEDENGFERTTEYKGHRSYQRMIRSGDQSLAEIMVFVDGRFTVQLDGQNIGWEDINKALGQIDFDALQEMSKTVASSN